MLAIYAGVLVVLVASALVGRAAWRLSGYERTSPIAPAVGLAVLFCIGAATVQLPGHAVTAGIFLAVVVGASVFVPGVRDDVRTGWLDALVVGGVVLLAVSLPFAVSGRAGVLGVGNNNDMTFHMTSVFWLQTHTGVATEAVVHGYPLGPHAVIAGIGEVLRLSIPAAFTGLTLAVQVLTGYAALAGLARERRWLRRFAAVLVALPYLAASYYAQGSFKETLQALFVLAFALALRDLRFERARARNAIPAGLLVGGMISVYSYFGLLWPIATVAILVAGSFVLDYGARPSRAARRALVHATPFAVAGVAALVFAVAGQAGRIVKFTTSSYAHQPLEGKGNLHGPLSELELLGIWPTGDFRFHPAPWGLTVALALFTAVVLAVAWAWWIRRRELAVPAALGAALFVYWQATIFKNTYNAAKALVIVTPLAALVIAGALLATTWPRRRMLAAVAIAIAVPSAASSFLALRDGLVGPTTHEQELATFRPRIVGHPTLFLGTDDFVWWELRGAHVGAPRVLYSTWTVHRRPEKILGRYGFFDFDSLPATTLDLFDYVVTPRSPYQSSAPANFREQARTADYVLWRRVGPTPSRKVLPEGDAPGMVLDCNAAPGRRVAQSVGTAAVRAKPVVADAETWRGTAQDAGESATIAVPLKPGTWDLSMQYVSREGIHVTATGLDISLPANLDRMGPYFPLGTVTVSQPTTLQLRARTNDLPWLGRALGSAGRTLAIGGVDVGGAESIPVGNVAATPHDWREQRVPLRRACGRYVDWYTLDATA